MRQLSLLALLVAACSGPAAVTTTQSVGTTGGTVATGDGTGVVLPMGAVSGPTTISISPVTDPGAPTGTTVVGTGYLFGPEGTIFVNPVKISLAVVLSKLPAGKTIADVSIYTAPGGSTTYTKLDTTVVDATHVSATTNHFSVFVPAAPSSTSACTGTCVTTTGGCTCTASCSGTSYSMTCYSGEGCTCGTTSSTSITSTPLCSDISGLNAAWSGSATAAKTGCAYPGTVAASAP